MTAPEPLAPKSLVERLWEAAIAQRKAAYLPRHVDVADLLEEAARALTPKSPQSVDKPPLTKEAAELLAEVFPKPRDN